MSFPFKPVKQPVSGALELHMARGESYRPAALKIAPSPGPVKPISAHVAAALSPASLSPVPLPRPLPARKVIAALEAPSIMRLDVQRALARDAQQTQARVVAETPRAPTLQEAFSRSQTALELSAQIARQGPQSGVVPTGDASARAAHSIQTQLVDEVRLRARLSDKEIQARNQLQADLHFGTATPKSSRRLLVEAAALDYRAQVTGLVQSVAEATGSQGMAEHMRRERQRDEAAVEHRREKAKEQGFVATWQQVQQAQTHSTSVAPTNGVMDTVFDTINLGLRVGEYAEGLLLQSLPDLAVMAGGGILGRAAATRAGITAGAALTGAGIAGGALVSVPVSAGRVLSEQRQQSLALRGEEHTHLSSALALGTVNAVVNSALGMERMFSTAKLAGPAGTLSGGRVALTAGGESLAEMITVSSERAGAKVAVPELTYFNAEYAGRLWESARDGFIAGGSVGGTGQFASAPFVRHAPQSTEEPERTSFANELTQAAQQAVPRHLRLVVNNGPHEPLDPRTAHWFDRALPYGTDREVWAQKKNGTDGGGEGFDPPTETGLTSGAAISLVAATQTALSAGQRNVDHGVTAQTQERLYAALTSRDLKRFHALMDLLSDPQQSAAQLAERHGINPGSLQPALTQLAASLSGAERLPKFNEVPAVVAASLQPVLQPGQTPLKYLGEVLANPGGWAKSQGFLLPTPRDRLTVLARHELELLQALAAVEYSAQRLNADSPERTRQVRALLNPEAHTWWALGLSYRGGLDQLARDIDAELAARDQGEVGAVNFSALWRDSQHQGVALLLTKENGVEGGLQWRQHVGTRDSVTADIDPVQVFGVVRTHPQGNALEKAREPYPSDIKALAQVNEWRDVGGQLVASIRLGPEDHHVIYFGVPEADLPRNARLMNELERTRRIVSTSISQASEQRLGDVPLKLAGLKVVGHTAVVRLASSPALAEQLAPITAAIDAWVRQNPEIKTLRVESDGLDGATLRQYMPGGLDEVRLTREDYYSFSTGRYNLANTLNVASVALREPRATADQNAPTLPKESVDRAYALQTMYFDGNKTYLPAHRSDAINLEAFLDARAVRSADSQRSTTAADGASAGGPMTVTFGATRPKVMPDLNPFAWLMPQRKGSKTQDASAREPSHHAQDDAYLQAEEQREFEAALEALDVSELNTLERTLKRLKVEERRAQGEPVLPSDSPIIWNQEAHKQSLKALRKHFGLTEEAIYRRLKNYYGDSTAAIQYVDRLTRNKVNFADNARQGVFQVIEAGDTQLLRQLADVWDKKVSDAQLRERYGVARESESSLVAQLARRLDGIANRVPADPAEQVTYLEQQLSALGTDREKPREVLARIAKDPRAWLVGSSNMLKPINKAEVESLLTTDEIALMRAYAAGAHPVAGQATPEALAKKLGYTSWRRFELAFEGDLSQVGRRGQIQRGVMQLLVDGREDVLLGAAEFLATESDSQRHGADPAQQSAYALMQAIDGDAAPKDAAALHKALQGVFGILARGSEKTAQAAAQRIKADPKVWLNQVGLLKSINHTDILGRLNEADMAALQDYASHPQPDEQVHAGRLALAQKLGYDSWRLLELAYRGNLSDLQGKIKNDTRTPIVPNPAQRQVDSALYRYLGKGVEPPPTKPKVPLTDAQQAHVDERSMLGDRLYSERQLAKAQWEELSAAVPQEWKALANFLFWASRMTPERLAEFRGKRASVRRAYLLAQVTQALNRVWPVERRIDVNAISLDGQTPTDIVLALSQIFGFTYGVVEPLKPVGRALDISQPPAEVSALLPQGQTPLSVLENLRNQLLGPARSQPRKLREPGAPRAPRASRTPGEPSADSGGQNPQERSFAQFLDLDTSNSAGVDKALRNPPQLSSEQLQWINDWLGDSDPQQLLALLDAGDISTTAETDVLRQKWSQASSYPAGAAALGTHLRALLKYLDLVGPSFELTPQQTTAIARLPLAKLDVLRSYLDAAVLGDEALQVRSVKGRDEWEVRDALGLPLSDFNALKTLSNNATARAMVFDSVPGAPAAEALQRLQQFVADIFQVRKNTVNAEGRNTKAPQLGYPMIRPEHVQWLATAAQQKSMDSPVRNLSDFAKTQVPALTLGPLSREKLLQDAEVLAQYQHQVATFITQHNPSALAQLSDAQGQHLVDTLDAVLTGNTQWFEQNLSDPIYQRELFIRTILGLQDGYFATLRFLTNSAAARQLLIDPYIGQPLITQVEAFKHQVQAAQEARKANREQPRQREPVTPARIEAVASYLELDQLRAWVEAIDSENFLGAAYLTELSEGYEGGLPDLRKQLLAILHERTDMHALPEIEAPKSERVDEPNASVPVDARVDKPVIQEVPPPLRAAPDVQAPKPMLMTEPNVPVPADGRIDVSVQDVLVQDATQSLRAVDIDALENAQPNTIRAAVLTALARLSRPWHEALMNRLRAADAQIEIIDGLDPTLDRITEIYPDGSTGLARDVEGLLLNTTGTGRKEHQSDSAVPRVQPSWTAADVAAWDTARQLRAELGATVHPSALYVLSKKDLTYLRQLVTQALHTGKTELLDLLGLSEFSHELVERVRPLVEALGLKVHENALITELSQRFSGAEDGPVAALTHLLDALDREVARNPHRRSANLRALLEGNQPQGGYTLKEFKDLQLPPYLSSVLWRLMEGHDRAKIAKDLGVDRRVVKTYVNALRQRLSIPPGGDVAVEATQRFAADIDAVRAYLEEANDTYIQGNVAPRRPNTALASEVRPDQLADLNMRHLYVISSLVFDAVKHQALWQTFFGGLKPYPDRNLRKYSNQAAVLLGIEQLADLADSFDGGLPALSEALVKIVEKKIRTEHTAKTRVEAFISNGPIGTYRAADSNPLAQLDSASAKSAQPSPGEVSTWLQPRTLEFKGKTGFDLDLNVFSDPALLVLDSVLRGLPDTNVATASGLPLRVVRVYQAVLPVWLGLDQHQGADAVATLQQQVNQALGRRQLQGSRQSEAKSSSAALGAPDQVAAVQRRVVQQLLTLKPQETMGLWAVTEAQMSTAEAAAALGLPKSDFEKALNRNIARIVNVLGDGSTRESLVPLLQSVAGPDQDVGQLLWRLTHEREAWVKAQSYAPMFTDADLDRLVNNPDGDLRLKARHVAFLTAWVKHEGDSAKVREDLALPGNMKNKDLSRIQRALGVATYAEWKARSPWPLADFVAQLRARLPADAGGAGD